MKTPINYEDGKVYDYVYTSSEHEHHHDYLMPSLLKLINSISEQGTKQLSILDIGCGSGWGIMMVFCPSQPLNPFGT